MNKRDIIHMNSAIFCSRKDKDEARECLRRLQEDVEAQLLFLEGNAQYPWDTQDFDNWEAMYDNIIRIANLLKLDVI